MRGGGQAAFKAGIGAGNGEWKRCYCSAGVQQRLGVGTKTNVNFLRAMATRTMGYAFDGLFEVFVGVLAPITIALDALLSFPFSSRVPADWIKNVRSNLAHHIPRSIESSRGGSRTGKYLTLWIYRRDYRDYLSVDVSMGGCRLSSNGIY